MAIVIVLVNAPVLASNPSSHLRHWARRRIPDVGGILSDRSIAREFARTGDIHNRLPRPAVAVRVKRAQGLVRLQIRLQISQMHVVVTVLEQGVVQRRKNALLVLAEIVARYEVQGGPGLGLVLVVPIRIVPAAALIDLLRAQPEQEEVLS